MIRNLLQRFAACRRARREARTAANARSAIQVCEFDGALWLCHNNVPIVREDWADCPLPQLAEKARLAWKQFYSETGT